MTVRLSTEVLMGHQFVDSKHKLYVDFNALNDLFMFVNVEQYKMIFGGSGLCHIPVALWLRLSLNLAFQVALSEI